MPTRGSRLGRFTGRPSRVPTTSNHAPFVCAYTALRSGKARLRVRGGKGGAGISPELFEGEAASVFACTRRPTSDASTLSNRLLSFGTCVARVVWRACGSKGERAVGRHSAVGMLGGVLGGDASWSQRRPAFQKGTEHTGVDQGSRYNVYWHGTSTTHFFHGSAKSDYACSSAMAVTRQ